jgi:hypothetical protein
MSAGELTFSRPVSAGLEVCRLDQLISGASSRNGDSRGKTGVGIANLFRIANGMNNIQLICGAIRRMFGAYLLPIWRAFLPQIPKCSWPREGVMRVAGFPSLFHCALFVNNSTQV